MNIGEDLPKATVASIKTKGGKMGGGGGGWGSEGRNASLSAPNSQNSSKNSGPAKRRKGIFPQEGKKERAHGVR